MKKSDAVNKEENTAVLWWKMRWMQAAQMPWLAAVMMKQEARTLNRLLRFCQRLRCYPRRWQQLLRLKMATTLMGASLLLALSSAPVHAATINVDGSCSLVDAITAANTDTAVNGCAAGSGADTIVLPTNGTINLTTVNNNYFGPNGFPAISSDITIEGNGTTIQGPAVLTTTVPLPPSMRFFVVDSSGALTLNNITLNGGQLTGFFEPAPAIYNQGTLTIDNSQFTNNENATLGSAIISVGTMTIENSVFSGNSSLAGGAVYGGGNILLDNIVVEETSSPAAVLVGNGNVTIQRSQIINNDGSGIAVIGTTTLTIEDSVVSGNGHNAAVSTGSGIVGGTNNSEMLTLNIRNSTISDNQNELHAGGIGLSNQGGALINLEHNTITGNSSVSGISGGLGLEGTGTVTLTLQSNLIAGNSAPASSEIFVENTAVIGNGYNLIGHSGSSGITGFMLSGSDFTPMAALADILETTLADNGGNTLTHALVADSPAIDVFPAPCVVDADQRGVLRPQNGRCDAGAFEVEAQPIRINFQPATAAVPDGYLVDDGAIFGSRGDGLSYGWDSDNSITMRDRDKSNSPDQRHDTLAHMQLGGIDRTWELSVTNGVYLVHAVAGDVQNPVVQAHHLNIEGVTLIAGTQTVGQKWIAGSAIVTVNDGRLTLSNGAGATGTNKVNFIEVTPLAAAASGFQEAINFQEVANMPVAGYEVDSGQLYGARGNGLTYGWDADMTLLARDRDRPNALDQRYDTFNHMQMGSLERMWEVSVPNGTYAVTVAGGDSQLFNGSRVYAFDVEGVDAVDGDGTVSGQINSRVVTVVVMVQDGRLTITNGDTAVANKIQFVHITQISG